MMQLEICEGALRQSQKKYEDQYGSGTAVTLRMTSSWHGKAHIVVGDSAFSFVATAVALKQNGTYFVGIVKTASKMYPKQFMQTTILKNVVPILLLVLQCSATRYLQLAG